MFNETEADLLKETSSADNKVRERSEAKKSPLN